MKTKLTIALVALMTGTAFAAFQAPLPEFKYEKQLAEWRAKKVSEATSQGYAAETTVFYTGKPYIESSGSYVFKYRSYSPDVARWTSEDPSGFPDGANGSLYVNNSCILYFDPNGLAKIAFTTNNFTHPGSAMNAYARGEFEYELDTNGGYTFTKNTGAYTTSILGTHADNSDPNDTISAALGAFVVKDSGVETSILGNGTTATREWIILKANFNITQNTGGVVTTSEWESAASAKIYANWKE